MLCERCKQRQATTSIKHTLNGHSTTFHVCSECAHAMASLNLFGGLNFDHLLSEMFAGDATKADETKRCPKCGMSFEELMEGGKLGCAACYQTFRTELLPSVQRIHGKSAHNGKVPKTAGRAVQRKRQLASLQQQLDQAISAEQFEHAAELRDQIKALQREAEQHE